MQFNETLNPAQIVFSNRYLRKLILNFRIEWTFRTAFALNRVDILEEYKDKFNVNKNLIRGYCDYNNSGLVLYEKDGEKYKRQCFEYPANGLSRYGHLQLLKWIHSNLHETEDDLFSHYAIYVAASNNHLELLQWLFDNIHLLNKYDDYDSGDMILDSKTPSDIVKCCMEHESDIIACKMLRFLNNFR
jgi:hypothetical protein